MRRWDAPLTEQEQLAQKIGNLIRSLPSERQRERELLYGDELAVRHGDSDWRERGEAALARHAGEVAA